MVEWLTLANIHIIATWVEKWTNATRKSKDFSKLRKHLSLRELYLLRCMREYGRPIYAKHFGPALARWDDLESNAGWQKAAEYACKNLVVLGLVEPRGSEVAISELGKALIDEERNQAGSTKVFAKKLPSY